MSDEEFLKKYELLNNELYELKKEDLKDQAFFRENKLVNNLLNKNIEEKQLKYRDYIKEELEGATKEEIIRKKYNKTMKEEKYLKNFILVY